MHDGVPMPSALESALDLARRGFRVFPLHPNAKTPVFKGWPTAATTDETTIRLWWSEDPKRNVGLATGQWSGEGDVVVIDADCKGDRPGLVSLDLMEALEGLPPSLRVRSPSGGVHHFTIMPSGTGITVSADKIPDYPGIDIRGQGGYVAAPGSVIDGVAYEIVEDRALAEAPAGIVTLARAAQGRQREVKEREAVAEVDTVEAILRASEWLRNGAPEALEGAGGDQTTFAVAARLRDYGLSRSTAYELLSVHWNEAGKASPPWSPDELRQKIDNAFAYGKNPAGVRLASAEFDVVPEAEPGGHRWETGVKGKRNKLFAIDFETSADMALAEDAEPLVAGLLDLGAMSVLYGASNSGKTFVGLDMGFHIAAALPWQGRSVASGLVVHLVLEGGRGIHTRLAALRKRYEAAIAGRRVPFVIVPCPIDMRSSDADVKALVAMIREIADAYGVPVRLVIVDTLSRALAGGEENGSQDMGAFVAHADHLRSSLDCHAMIIHHSGKDAARGARGHSLLRAATDTEIEIVDNTIRATKQREMATTDAIRFELEPIEIGRTASGRAKSSCTIKLLSGSEFAPVALSGAATEMWEAFQDAAQDLAREANGDPAGWQSVEVTTEAWDASYRAARSGADEAKDVSARWTRKLRKEVADSGRVRQVVENKWISAQP